jgi:type VI secretion system protein ImpA
MLDTIDLDAIGAPISDESPSGEDLRYAKDYDDIKEARRADDDVPQGEWQRETKSADWDKVTRIALDALTSKTKDLQIAAWLTEALANEEGFAGVESGLRVLSVLLTNFWDTVYPLIEDDDYDYRVAPLEFLNDKLTAAIKNIPLTDPRATQGYSFLKWKESRDVGYESDSRRERREELVSDGKLPAEEFDTAVAKTSAAFYKALADALTACTEAFSELDAKIDEMFGSHAPRMSDIGQVLDECNRLVIKICREQKGLKDAVEAAEETADAGGAADESVPRDAHVPSAGGQPPAVAAISIPTCAGGDESQETAVWNEALRIMQGSGGFRDALNLLLAASSSQPSERGRSRYRFLVAKLCLKAGRPDLAKPIVEQLHTMIEDLHLESWESPYWISEILESLYQCLMSADYADEDPARAQELFRRICTLDVTKALGAGRT